MLKTFILYAALLLLISPGHGCDLDGYNRIAKMLIGRNLFAEEAAELCAGREVSREEFISRLLSKPEFIKHNYSLLRFELLQGANDDDVFGILIDLDQIRQFHTGESQAFGAFEYPRMFRLDRVLTDYSSGSIDLREVQQRLLDNYLYDQLNMGIDNFIYSSFQYMIGRAPTAYELRQAKIMCTPAEKRSSGKEQAFLFYQKGDSKQAYLDILTSNDNYLEYQITYWYERLLLRKPDRATVISLMQQEAGRGSDRIIENIIQGILLSDNS